MKKLFILLIAMVFSTISWGQIAVTVTGNTNTTPNLAASYTSLANALTGLNAVNAMSGPVILTLASGSETAPATGLTIGSSTLNPVLSATKTITIVKASGTVTLNAGTGTATPGSAAPDGILKLLGADYITIDGLTFTDGNTTNPATMEFGVALFKRAAGDGCNNNTIQNCTFNMQRVNNASGTSPMIEGSVAILVINSTATAATTVLTPTNGGTLATNGTNSGNKFYTNSINGGNYGIGLSGYAATLGVGPTPTATTFLGDLGNDIGGSSLSNGNTILNYGGGAATSASAGIRANNQWSINISYNTVNNNNGSGVNHATTLRGIYAQAGTSANATITYNNITIKGGGTTSQVAALENGIGATPLLNTVNINYNNITGNYLTATSGVFYGIYNNTTAPTTLNIQNNSVNGWAYSASSLTGSGAVYPIYTTGSSATTTLNATFNTINNITRTGTTGGTTNGILISGGVGGMVINVNNNTVTNISIDGTGTASTLYGISVPTSTVSVNNNQINNLTCIKTTGTGELNGIRSFSSPTNENYKNNTVHTITHYGTGIVYGIHANTTTGTRTLSGNTVHTLSTAGTTIAGILNASSSPNVFNNKVYNITSTSTGAPIVSGIILSSVGTAGSANIYNNFISNLTAPNSSGTNLLRGLNITNTTATTSVNVYFNTIYIDASSSGTNFGSSCVFHTYNATQTTSLLDMRNNILINKCTPAGTGYAVAFSRSASTDLNNYSTNSNKNNFWGTSGIYYDGTNLSSTLSSYKSLMITRDQGSFDEDITFINSTSAPYDLHLDASTPTQCESGGIAISGITTDFDGDTRDASTPDVGADEGTFTPQDLSAPNIAYTALPNTITTTGVTLTATITDASGVPQSGPGLPNLYWTTVAANSYQAVEGTWVSGNTYTFNFATPVVAGDTIKYYIVAQDNANNVGAFPSAGAGSISFTSDPPACDPPPTTPSSFNILLTLSGTYTVGSGGDYTTLTAAVADLNSKQIVGPVTFELLDATYTTPAETFPVTFNQNQGSNATNTLTIRPASGVTASIYGTSTTSIIKFFGADYMTIDGSNSGGTTRDLTIENTAISGTTTVINIQSDNLGAKNNTVKNCIIKNGYLTTGSSAISIGGSTINSTGPDNDNVTIQNNQLEKSYYGIYVGSATLSTDNLQIIDNVIGSDISADYISTYGIYMTASSGAAINNCLISGNTIKNMKYDISKYAIYMAAYVTNTRISKNKIYGLGQIGTGTAYYCTGIYDVAATNTDLTIDNNVIYDFSHYGSTSAFYMVGIRLVGGTNKKVYNNSVHFSGAFTSVTSGVGSACLYMASAGSNYDIRNNIFSNTTTGTSVKTHTVYSAATHTGLIINNNDYYTTGTVFGYWGADKADFAAWKASSLQDNFSFNADPQFTSNTDLHINSGLSQSYLESTGASLAAVTTDFEGDTRPGPASSVNGGGLGYDIGADEFDGVPYPAMTYISSTLTQTNTSYVLPSSVNNHIVGFEVVSSGVLYPLELTQFALDLTGTGVAGTDFTNAKIFYTGSSSTFASTSQFGTTVATPSASFSVTGSQILSSGTNYFWLSFDVPASGATNAATLDVSCSAIKIAGIDQTPTTTDPAGSRSILTSLAGTYTVGTGGDFVKLSDVFTASNSLGLSGNVTLNIISNITETATCNLNQWTETGAGNYTLTINPVGNDTISGSIAGALIKLSGADRVTIDGLNTGGNSLTLKNNSTATSTSVIWISSLGTGIGSVDNTIKNLNIIGGSISVTSQFGIFVGGTSVSTTGTGADNDNLTIENNVISKSYYGIFTRGTNPDYLNNLIIKNNTIGSATATDYVTFRGIDVAAAVSPLISQNHIYNLQLATTVNNSGIEIGSDVSNALISRNHIHGLRNTSTSGYGSYGINFNSNTGVLNNEISNNVIYDILTYGDGGTSQSILYNPFGIRLTGGNGTKVYYNTVSFSGALSSTGAFDISSCLLLTVNTVTASDVRNNIFVNNMTATNAGSKTYTVYAPTGTTFANIDFNDYYVSGANGVLAFLGSDKTNLGDWQTATTYDMSSVSGDPVFISATNLKPLSTIPLNNADPTVAVTTDYTGALRSATPDMGAYEFEQPAIDLGAIALVSPSINSAGCYSNSETVTITVKNNGTSNIDFSVNPLTINTNVSGAVTALLSATVNTGSIVAGATMNVDMSTNLDMTTIGVYTFNSSTLISGDELAINDAMPAVTRTRTALSAGTITGSPLTLCFSGTPTFTISGNTGGNIQWQESIVSNSGPWNNVGSNSTTYAPGTLNSTTYYQAVLSCYTDNATTNNLSVTVNAPAVATTTPASICSSGIVTLGATASSGTLNWYAAASGGTSLGSGETFNTPPLTSTTSYYVGASFGSSAFVGAYNNAIGTTSSSTLTNHYMIFNVLAPVTTIESVDIFPSVAAGASYTIILQNSSLTQIASYSGVTTVASGQRQTVPVNFVIPNGTGYRLGMSINPGLYRNTTGAVYPYTASGLISITGNTFDTQYYYYFYNWKMSDLCESPRQEVVATVYPTTVGGIISGTSSVVYGSSTGTLTLGSYTGAILKWQKNLNNGTWTDISNTSNTYSEIPSSAGTWYYRALVQSGVCSEQNSDVFSLTVSQKDLSISGVTANNRMYNGLVGATLNTSSAALVGVETVDLSNVTLDLSGISAYFADKNVANNKPVTAIGFAITGSASGNYTLSQPTLLTANITPVNLTVTGASVTTKIYDGTTLATITGAALSGVISPDAVSIINGTSGLFNDMNIGSGKSVTTNMTLGGAGAANYTVSQPTLTGTIIAKGLTVVSASVTTKVYDGTTLATITGAALSGVVSPDVVTLLNATSGTFSDKNIGTGKTVTSAMTLGGAGSGNYTLTQPTLSGNIIAKGLTVVSANVTTKIYDGTTLATITGATLSGVISPDVVTLLNATTGTFSDKNIGTGKTVTSAMTLGGAGAGNYTLTQPTLSGNIIAKELTISGASVTPKVYDGNIFATIAGATLNGVISPDVVSLMNSTTGTYSDKNVGNGKTVTTTMTISGAGAGNYTLTQPTLSGNITPKPLFITADDKSKTHDGLVYSPFTVTYSGFVSGEGVAALGGSLVIGGSAITATNIGNYTIIPGGLTSVNYNITYVNGTLVILQAITSTVLNNNDAGYGSLRDAIANISEGGTLLFDDAVDGQTIILTTGPIIVNKSLKFDNSNHEMGVSINGDDVQILFGKSLTLLTGSKLSVLKSLINYTGRPGLIINSGASFIHNTKDLPATVIRELNDGWHLFGSPFKKNMGASLANLIPSGGGVQMRPYTNGYSWGAITSSPYILFNPMVGYAVKPSANVNASLTGNLFYTPITFEFNFNLSYTGGSASQSWNLVSNPYTSPIDWRLLSRTNVNSTLYLWDNTMYSYFPIVSASYFRTYNGLTNIGVPANTLPYIAPQQGFFVKAVWTNPKLGFAPKARVHNTTNYYKASNTTEVLLRLKTESEYGADEMVICKNQNAKQNLEDFDSEKMLSDLPLEMYSQAASGEKLTINTIENTDIVIPLVIKGNVGSKAKITAFALESAEEVYLEDRLTNKLISLTENTSYSFEFPTELVEGRFFIRFGKMNTPLNSSEIKVFANNNELNVIAQTGEELQQVEVYTITGACVFKSDINNGNKFNTKLDLSTGVYMVRVKTSVSTQNVKINWK